MACVHVSQFPAAVDAAGLGTALSSASLSRGDSSDRGWVTELGGVWKAVWARKAPANHKAQRPNLQEPNDGVTGGMDHFQESQGPIQGQEGSPRSA